MDITERRRAAEALRAIKRGGEGWFSLSDAVLGRPATRDEVVARLADLIEPGDSDIGPKTLHAMALSRLNDWEREAIAWVREHGGLHEVRRDYQDADNRCVELCAALGIDTDTGWSDAMAEMVKRLMPEGMEGLVDAWPRFEDGSRCASGTISRTWGESRESNSALVGSPLKAPLETATFSSRPTSASIAPRQRCSTLTGWRFAWGTRCGASAMALSSPSPGFQSRWSIRL